MDINSYNCEIPTDTHAIYLLIKKNPKSKSAVDLISYNYTSVSDTQYQMQVFKQVNNVFKLTFQGQLDRIFLCNHKLFQNKTCSMTFKKKADKIPFSSCVLQHDISLHLLKYHIDNHKTSKRKEYNRFNFHQLYSQNYTSNQIRGQK